LKSTAFVQEKFREYYDKDFSLTESLLAIEKREFGFASFEKWMLRHKSFKNEEELTSFLRSFVPKDAYFSCATYEAPETEMEKKGWLAADLIFDIDADHVPTSCDKIHDEWRCGNCGHEEKGIPPTNCPKCTSAKLDVNTWPCEVCLDSAKTETIKLLDMLMQDFGFAKKEVHTFFSGHRGYHIHIENEAIKTLDTVARKEIVDYVSGLGLNVTFHAGKDPRPNSLGWSGRIAKAAHDFVRNVREEDLIDLKLQQNIARNILKNRDAILRGWDKLGVSNTIKGLGPENWKKILELCVRNQSAKIDTVVTTDIHRLIRLNDALHGKTGFKKVGFPISDIEDFDPFQSAVAFKRGKASVLVSDAPEFRLGDEHFGPYKKQKVELPTAAAILLICRNRAEVVE
jgi:DNA primase small subunit